MRPVFHAAAVSVGRTRLAVAICSGLVLVACSAETPISPTPATSTTPSAPSAPPVESDWQILGGGPLPGGQAYLTDVAARGDTVVAMGAVADSSAETTTAQAWVSRAGGAWAAATVEGSEGAWPQTVIPTDSGFLAVGWTGCATSLQFAYADPRSCQTAVWTSGDGTTWARQPDPRMDSSALTGVVRWNGGFLAVGGKDIGTTAASGQGARPTDPGATAVPGTEGRGNPSPAGIILRSDDGTAWEEIRGTDMTGAPLSAIATDGERLVAVSLAAASSGRPEGTPASAWTSTDAVHWTEQPLKTEVFPFVYSVASTPGGFVTSGMAPGFMGVGSGPASWRETADGWIELGLSTGWDERIFTDLAVGPAGALIVGVDARAGTPLLYGSQDGSAWQSVDVTGDLANVSLQPTTLAWAGSRFLLGGQARTGDGVQSFVLAGLPHLPSAAEVAAATAEPTPTPEPVTLEAGGRAWLELEDQADFTPQRDGYASCMSVYGGTAVQSLSWSDGGVLNGQVVHGEVWFADGAKVGGSASVNAWLGETRDARGPNWFGSATVAEVSAAGAAGRLVFDNVALEDETPDATRSEWPARLSGGLGWSCKPWQDPNATPPPSASGNVSLSLDTEGWIPSGADASCGRSVDASVSTVWAMAGTLLGEPVRIELHLDGDHRVGQAVQVWLQTTMTADPYEETPRWSGTVTIERVADDDSSGAGTIQLEFMADVEGWPATLAGTIAWACSVP
jgi:hypothetical protein